MLNPQTMTPEQEQQARAQAFYLLKKFTSYTFLDKARALYQGYLNAFEKLENDYSLRNPETYKNDGEYKEHLSYMIPIEEGLNLLRTTPHKLEAYQRFEGCTLPISYRLFGRSAHEKGISYSPFFQALGMAEEDSGLPDTGVVKDVWDMTAIMSTLESTVFDRLIVNNETWKGATAYNYETLFEEPYYKALPRYKRPFEPYIYPFNFPTPLPACPAHNTNKEGEVWSGEEIQIHGIYEPWLLSNKVGCPNYFLAGQKAIEYQIEGTEDKEAVRWRLIWEDKRYLDGSIAPQESWYLQEPLVVTPFTPVLSAQPGQACPKAGLWFAPHLKMRELRLRQGESMPVQQVSETGSVIWYFKGE